MQNGYDNDHFNAVTDLHGFEAHLDNIDSMELDDDYIPSTVTSPQHLVHPPDNDPDLLFFDCKSISDQDFDPVSDSSHYPTPKPKNDPISAPYPNQDPQLSCDPSPDQIDTIINGTFNPSVVIKDHDGYLTIERSLVYTYPMFEEIDKSLDIMHEVDEVLNTVEGAPFLHGCSAAYVDTIYDTSYFNDLSVGCRIEP